MAQKYLLKCYKTLRFRPAFTGVLSSPGQKVAYGVLCGCFWALGSECPKQCFLTVSWCFLAPTTPKNTRKHSVGHSKASAQEHFVGHFPARATGHSCTWRQGECYKTPESVGHYLRDWSESVNVIGVITEGQRRTNQ